MMSFELLVYLTRFNIPSFLIVPEWAAKREQLHVQLYDLPRLVQAYQERDRQPYTQNPQITLESKVPGLRLANACEAIANCLYAISDISANFANKVSQGEIPSKFTRIRKKLDDEWKDHEIAHVLGELQWYRKIREMRTEWTHFSSIFIAHGDNGEPLISIRSYRYPKDKQEFTTDYFCKVTELIEWTQKAIQTFDDFGEYLLFNYVVYQFELERKIRVPIYDKNGYPLINKDHTFSNQEITIAEFLAASGVVGKLFQGDERQKEFAKKILEIDARYNVVSLKIKEQIIQEFIANKQE